MNWVIKPNLFNHTTLAYDRWHMQGNQLSGGVGWNQKLGLGLPNAPVFNKAGFPSINFSGPQGYKIGRHTSELQSHLNLVCRLLLEKKKTKYTSTKHNHITEQYI